ncbi:MAG: CoA pyrophosphatase [Motiliproteus sp.]|nr:CoA pyrophosphatase [Motiliproteus sp.]MCW9052414.1 CoA pyrophosphatase [Motiliproteus sp.]
MANKIDPDNLLERLEFGLQRYHLRSINNQSLQAGVLLALTDDPFDPQVVLTQRAHTLSSHGGEVAFPGGKKDEEDDSLLTTALREAHEEIGLHPERVRVLSQLGQCVSKHGLLVTPFVGVVPADIELQANPGELDSVFKAPLRYFLDHQKMTLESFSYKGSIIHMPRYDYQGYRIWGLTAYILVELLNFGLAAKIPLNPRPEMAKNEAQI